ncbi:MULTISPECIES: fluoride efflux transporter FluC [Streptomyces]|uniref:Fluoride-specific ion channel FluC n=2 Tax=Streptomyces TaxID=1883 RepID=A0ABU2RR81_9ACTN|nr:MULTISPECIES: CrcB family protein [unclassified Streptomyces]MBK3593785.1 CrcB family protein [Streptomyces sp. MBT51]MDT0431181.1 CrcB family protein [Streptomyces sp. DSM 41770]
MTSEHERPSPRPTGWPAEPADPDTAVDPWPPRVGRTPARERAGVLTAIAAGGVVGACARYGATLIWPVASTAFPWTTFWINVTGCAAMGVLMVLVTERFRVHPLVRPFLGTGVLGGYTTFSTATLDTQRLLDAGRPGTGLLYAAATLTAAFAALWAAATLTRRAFLPQAGVERGRP